MAGIALTEAGNAIIYSSVPWAHKMVSLKTQSFPKGAVPAHLMSYLFKAGGAPTTCAKETSGKSGATRVRAMNACVSRLLKGKR